jgi:hypothetical protein
MTAEEEALELVNKFTYEISGIDKYNYCLDSHIRFTAKRCALIAVDEILNNFGLLIYGKTFYTSSNAVFFYKEVKQEIEKL